MNAFNGADHGPGAISPSQKRQRAKHACEPCRLRKRKCDGDMPCNMCKQFEYNCYFEKHPRKRSKIVEQNAQHESSTALVGPETAKEDRSGVEDALKVKNMEANSGIAFARLLGQRLDASAGSKVFTFGWNLGTASYIPDIVPPITDFLNQDEMYSLAQLHFQNVHLLYGFLEKDWILEQISLRWAQPHLCKAPDHLFANLAAVGSAFSSDHRNSMTKIVDSAKRALDVTSMMQPPNLLDVQSWLLRSLYLRLTAHPHACHMASCIAMHLMEGLGLHQEANDSALRLPTTEQTQDVETKRRTFWAARMLNTWVSFEFGRTRIALRGITTQLPTPREGDFTAEYVNLYSLSCCLDPERSDSKWEDFLRQLDEYEAKHDAIELSRANLGLAGSRRVRAANPNPSNETIDRIVKIGLRGIEASRRMAEKGSAWWHLANVPFQAVCVFLALDVQESLSHIGTAMRTLEYVAEVFDTVAVRGALKMARFLVRLSKKRKNEDAEILGEVLQKGPPNGDLQPEEVQTFAAQPMTEGEISLPLTDSPLTMNSEEWSHEVLKNFPDFDFSLFMGTDMTAFDSFAPDGMM